MALQREHNDQAWLAWHIAALSRVKKIPKLSSLQLKTLGDKQRQSQAEIAANMKMVFLAFGGSPDELEKFNVG